MERVNPLMPAFPPEIPMLQKGSAKEDVGMTMKHRKSTGTVTGIFLDNGLAFVGLISISPFFNSADDPGRDIVYIYYKKYSRPGYEATDERAL
jgi:hypothetical protein